MRVLIACEFSGVVRRAFRERGFDAWSSDLLPAEDGSPFHIHNDCLIHAYGGTWDLMIAHPPCTLLTKSGARWWNGREVEQEASLAFVRDLLAAPIRHIALENPPGRIGTTIRKADQTIQPWQFGHGEVKATSFWLKNLPHLRPTQIVDGRRPRVHYAAPGPNRWKERSRTLEGIASAMAEQWGDFVSGNENFKLSA